MRVMRRGYWIGRLLDEQVDHRERIGVIDHFREDVVISRAPEQDVQHEVDHLNGILFTDKADLETLHKITSDGQKIKLEPPLL